MATLVPSARRRLAEPMRAKVAKLVALVALVAALALPGVAVPGRASAGQVAAVTGGVTGPADGSATGRLSPALVPAGAAFRGRGAPVAPKVPQGMLSGVSCPSPASCMAVGDQALAMWWDGSTWAVHAARSYGPYPPSFASVSCPTATFCMAVGSYTGGSPGHFLPARPVAELWDGHAWGIEPVPLPKGRAYGVLTSVSCRSPSWCMAVGSSGAVPLAERWDGKSWAGTPVASVEGANGATLSVSCPGTGTCLAAGYYNRGLGSAAAVLPLAERWDGAGWHVLATPALGGSSWSGFNSVSCTGPQSCMAAGYYVCRGCAARNATMAASWAGAKWAYLTVPTHVGANSYLNGVSCASRASCAAVGNWGDGGVMAELWDGRSWSQVPVALPPDPGANGALDAVSCPVAGFCMAVGYYSGSGAPNQALAERWDGHRWSWAM